MECFSLFFIKICLKTSPAIGGSAPPRSPTCRPPYNPSHGGHRFPSREKLLRALRVFNHWHYLRREICRNNVLFYKCLFRIEDICLNFEILFYFLQNSVWKCGKNSKICAIFETLVENLHCSIILATKIFDTFSGVRGGGAQSPGPPRRRPLDKPLAWYKHPHTDPRTCQRMLLFIHL